MANAMYSRHTVPVINVGSFQPRIFTEDKILANLSLHSQLTTLGYAWPTLHTHQNSSFMFVWLAGYHILQLQEWPLTDHTFSKMNQFLQFMWPSSRCCERPAHTAWTGMPGGYGTDMNRSPKDGRWASLHARTSISSIFIICILFDCLPNCLRMIGEANDISEPFPMNDSHVHQAFTTESYCTGTVHTLIIFKLIFNPHSHWFPQ
jgi:hypothetical protein